MLDSLHLFNCRVNIKDRSCKTLKVVALSSFLGILLALGVAWVMARRITKPLNRIIGGLNEGSDQVSSASGQVSASSQSLAEGASEQAASIEETSSLKFRTPCYRARL